MMDDNKTNFKVVELFMLKKHIFFPLSGMGNFTAQTLLYPFQLLRTRLQLQDGIQVYRGLFHAITTVVRVEGFRGLYSGYLVRSVHIFSGSMYVSTYEITRNALSSFPSLTSTNRSFIGGGVASCVAQGFFVPVDVISQHLMVINYNRHGPKASNMVHLAKSNRPLTPVQLTEDEMRSNWSRIRGVVRYVRETHGFFGFYKGFFISLCTYVPSSALWWSFYDKFCIISHVVVKRFRNPDVDDADDSTPVSRLGLQLMSASLAGIGSAFFINPFDCVRVRMQVSHSSISQSVCDLWKMEGLRWLTKGLSARLIQSTFCSFWLVLVYEPIKIFCLKDEYRNQFLSLNS